MNHLALPHYEGRDTGILPSEQANVGLVYLRLITS